MHIFLSQATFAHVQRSWPPLILLCLYTVAHNGLVNDYTHVSVLTWLCKQNKSTAQNKGAPRMTIISTENLVGENNHVV
jgi:hypothetical protein